MENAHFAKFCKSVFTHSTMMYKLNTIPPIGSSSFQCSFVPTNYQIVRDNA